MNLKTRIKNKTLTFGVIGLGYVDLPREIHNLFHRGLPFTVEFAKAGFKVIGIDVDENKVNKINGGQSYIKDADERGFASLQFSIYCQKGK